MYSLVLRENRIDAQLDGDSLRLIYSDNGLGLPPDFEARSTASLGMQLVGVLVRQLGGEMKIDSDQGTRFTIIFPEKF